MGHQRRRALLTPKTPHAHPDLIGATTSPRQRAHDLGLFLSQHDVPFARRHQLGRHQQHQQLHGPLAQLRPEQSRQHHPRPRNGPSSRPFPRHRQRRPQPGQSQERSSTSYASLATLPRRKILSLLSFPFFFFFFKPFPPPSLPLLVPYKKTEPNHVRTPLRRPHRTLRRFLRSIIRFLPLPFLLLLHRRQQQEKDHDHKRRLYHPLGSHRSTPRRYPRRFGSRHDRSKALGSLGEGGRAVDLILKKKLVEESCSLFFLSVTMERIMMVGKAGGRKESNRGVV